MPLATLIAEQEFGIPVRRGDRVSVPGGTRALSYFRIRDPEKIDLASKFRASAFAQIGIYLSHGARMMILANHNECGFAPSSFTSTKEEEAWHIACLLAGYQAVREYLSNPIKGVDYSEVEIVLLYIIVDPETDLFIEAKLIDAQNGNVLSSFSLPEEKC